MEEGQEPVPERLGCGGLHCVLGTDSRLRRSVWVHWGHIRFGAGEKVGKQKRESLNDSARIYGVGTVSTCPSIQKNMSKIFWTIIQKVLDAYDRRL